MKNKILISLSVIALGISGIVIGCSGGGSSSSSSSSDGFLGAIDPKIIGTDLAYCDAASVFSTDAGDFNASQTDKKNVSNDKMNPNAQNRMMRLATVISPVASDGNTSVETKEAKVHPILLSYAEQVIGDYELGDGSADIGDPTHVDDIFVSLSRDDGQTWKKYEVGKTADKSSIHVQWDGTSIAYPGHSVKADMGVQGNNILVAWQDKYCPSGNPLDLNTSLETYPDNDFFQVNGSQGYIDYEGIVAPNGKTVYQVPFSCVWTARGVFNEETTEIDWMQAQQLTTGRRDAAKIWITPSPVGFALAWQEDPEGLRSGKGAGPGVGWSGATTNHGGEIWYSYLKMDDFNLSVVDDSDTKPKPLVNFAYPVRITDNENCKVGDTKLYCQSLCDTYGSVEVPNAQGVVTNRCMTGDVDMLTDTQVVMDGDTGASRPAMTILKTDGDINGSSEYVVILGYEETKGLAETDPGTGTQDQGTIDTNISVEGKSVYFERFLFDNPLSVAVSSGNIINQKYEDQNTSEMIYENARRLVIVSQVDTCDPSDYTFGFLYKQGVETQGGSSDMFLRMNTGFDASTLTPAVNVSTIDAVLDENGTVVDYSWTPTHLSANSYDNVDENTFSPRGFMRGNDIYIGYEYTPNYDKAEQGNEPNNFWVHRKLGGATMMDGWQVPLNISAIAGRKISTLDPRFVPTPKGNSASGLESDLSNPNVLFITYGTFDMESGEELNLYFSRSTDKGATWETQLNPAYNEVNAILAGIHEVEEKEVQTIPTPDGKRIYNAWLQESELNSTAADIFTGLDSWFGLVDYNISK